MDRTGLHWRAFTWFLYFGVVPFMLLKIESSINSANSSGGRQTPSGSSPSPKIKNDLESWSYCLYYTSAFFRHEQMIFIICKKIKQIIFFSLHSTWKL